MIKQQLLFKEEGMANILLGDEGASGGAGSASVKVGDTNNLTPISDDLKQYSTELGEATHLDATGNLVKEDGTIVKSKTDLDEFLASKKTTGDNLNIIQIGDKDYTLDKDGNALDSEGKIFMTKDKIAELEEDTTSTDINIEAIEKLSGYQVFDETGKPKTFDFTPEGLANREVAIVQQEVNKFKTEYPKLFLSENPDIADMLRYKQLYGSIEGYSNRVDYTKLTVDEKNLDQLFNLIVEAEKQSGKTPEKAHEIATMYKDANKLPEQGKYSFEILKNKQIEVENKLIKDKENAIKLQQDADNKYWSELKTTLLTKDVIAGITIPKTIQVKDKNGVLRNLTRQDIYDYVNKPVMKDSRTGETYSQYHVDKIAIEKARTLDDDIIDVIVQLTGKDTKSLIDAKVADNKVKDIINKKRFKLPASDNNYQSGENKGIDNIK